MSDEKAAEAPAQASPSEGEAKPPRAGLWGFVDGHPMIIAWVQLARPRRTGLGQLNLLVGASFVIASHGGDLRPLVHLMGDLAADAERRAEAMSSPDRLAHAIVRALVEASEPAVKGLGSAIDV